MLRDTRGIVCTLLTFATQLPMDNTFVLLLLCKNLVADASLKNVPEYYGHAGVGLEDQMGTEHHRQEQWETRKEEC